MRTIIFRSKSLDNGEWVYGDYHLRAGNVPAIIAMEPDKYGKVFYTVYQVIPDTVGQFTGLLDKNGKEIYEGDIVDYISPFFRDLTYPSYPEAPIDPKHFYRCVVVWNERDCGFGLVSLKEALLKPIEQQPVGITQISDSYLIGNIHDNPELLKP